MSLEAASTYVGFVLALIAFSYAFNQKTRLYIIPEGIYIGAFAANSLIQIYRSLFATAFDFILAGKFSLIIAVIIGLLAFARLTRFRWLARYPVAILSGAGVGALFGLSLRGQLLTPIGDTVKFVISAAWDPISKLVTIVTFIPVLVIFLYSRRYSDIVYEKRMPLYYLQRIGRIAFMVIVGYQIAGYAGVSTRFIQTVIKPVLDDIARLIIRA
jgi:hypothetical protein